MSDKFVPAAKIYRGKGVEAIHCAAVAVVNGEGKLTYYLGDPEAAFMTRSSIKPFQLLPTVISGAADRFHFSSEQLAIMCGSHTGSDKHRSVVESNLKQAGNLPEYLQCGTHWPLGMQLDNAYPLHDEDKDPLRHNCSGKHSGFLALAKFLGDEPGDYLKPDSRTQKLVKKTLAEYCEYDPELMTYGVDGCSAPNYPLPLIKLALGFKKLANGEGETSAVSQAARRIKEAMTQFPLMVSGEKRLDYDIKRAFPGNVVCKIGAESIEGLGFSEPKLGIAVKIIDGNSRALGAVCIEVLKQLGLIKKMDNFPYLQRYERPEVRNVRQVVTGHVAAEFNLQKV